jgi:hypothetical protein
VAFVLAAVADNESPGRSSIPLPIKTLDVALPRRVTFANPLRDTPVRTSFVYDETPREE